jgi:hypothetical protein
VHHVQRGPQPNSPSLPPSANLGCRLFNGRAQNDGQMTVE